MRTFIAIELPQEIKDRLGQLQDKLKKCGADVKWVEPKNIHLTLKFLGERDKKKIAQINEIIEETAKANDSFQARIVSIGAFPKIEFPRVIWLGIDKGNEEIKKIARELEEKIVKVGIPKENRSFSSHISIGRLKSPLNKKELVGELKNLAVNFGMENLEFAVRKITFFKSTLTPTGPIYEPLKEVNLRAT